MVEEGARDQPVAPAQGAQGHPESGLVAGDNALLKVALQSPDVVQDPQARATDEDAVGLGRSVSRTRA